MIISVLGNSISDCLEFILLLEKAKAMVKSPTLPINISTIKTNLLPTLKIGVIPMLSPTVDRAETHSKIILSKEMLSDSNMLISMTPRIIVRIE